MKIKPVFHYSLFMFALMLGTSQPAQAACEGKNLVVLGDSLVAGYGLGPGEAFPEQLGIALKSNGFNLSVTNAGVSGDTSSGGLARLDWSIGDGVDFVVVELGANDALRGIPVEITRENIDTMLKHLKQKGVEVALAGMMAPPNMGPAYGEAFNAIYPDLAEAHDVPLYPFFLDGVAAEAHLNQDDGIHPTAEGIGLIVEKFLPFIQPVLDEACAG